MKKILFTWVILFNSLGFAQTKQALYADDLLNVDLTKNFYSFADQTAPSIAIYANQSDKVSANCVLGDKSLIKILNVKPDKSIRFVAWKTILLQFPQNVIDQIYPKGKFQSLKKSEKQLGEIYYFLHENEFGMSYNEMLGVMESHLVDNPQLQSEFDQLVALNNRYAEMGHYDFVQTININDKDKFDTSKLEGVLDLHHFFEAFPNKMDEAQKIFNEIFKDAKIIDVSMYWVTFVLLSNTGDAEQIKCEEKLAYKFSLPSSVISKFGPYSSLTVAPQY